MSTHNGNAPTCTTANEPRGQVIFRIASIVFKAGTDGRRKAEPKIKKVLKLRGDPPVTNGPKDAPPTPEEPRTNFDSRSHPSNESQRDNAPEMAQLQAVLDAQREDINRISATGYQVVSSFETAVARVEQQVQQLRDSIDGVRKEGEGQRDDLRSLKSDLAEVKWESENNSVVSRLDQQLQTTDRVVTELRHAIGTNQMEVADLREELSTTKEQLDHTNEENTRLKQQLDDTTTVAEEAVVVSKEYASEVTSLRRDVKQLRAELSKERSNPPRPDNTSFSSHELDILASNISKIGNRANQIESLQMEFDLFRSRVQRLESRANTPAISRNDRREPIDEFTSSRDELSQPTYGGSMRKKRTSTGRDDDEIFEMTPPKRVAVTSDYSSAATTGESHQSSPLGVGAVAGANLSGARRAKSGGADKRSMKRSSWGARR